MSTRLHTHGVWLTLPLSVIVAVDRLHKALLKSGVYEFLGSLC